MKTLYLWFCIFISIIAMMHVTATVAQSLTNTTTEKEWTILVYLNAKNNLEDAGLTDFYEMKQVGSNDKINVVVQLGRPTKHFTTADGNWSGVKRFFVTQTTKPIPEHAVIDLDKKGLNTDMADPSTLEDFIRWGIENYPAKYHMLVIWNHGQGWRFQLADDPNLKNAAAKQQRSNTESQMLIGVQTPIATTGGYRAVSSDDDTGGILYNRQIQDVLEKLVTDGKRFDIIGFDACLMSMVETAYALRKTADYMVASQELEPGTGWNYSDILQRLTANPNIKPAELSKLLVESYKSHYKDGNRTTLAAIDLSQIEALAESLSSLSLELLEDLQIQRKNIGAARASTRSFADWAMPPLLTSIDLHLFLSQLHSGNSNQKIKNKIDVVLNKLNNSIISNYRSAPITDDGYGGSGLAIYFPRDKKSFIEDRYSDGYLLTNNSYPLEFVTSPKTNGWAQLILTYLQIQ